MNILEFSTSHVPNDFVKKIKDFLKYLWQITEARIPESVVPA